MSCQLDVRRRFLVVVVFAVAMAWLDSAVVFYLRTLVHRIVPDQPNPLPIAGDIGGAERVRRPAGVRMLFGNLGNCPAKLRKLPEVD